MTLIQMIREIWMMRKTTMTMMTSTKTTMTMIYRRRKSIRRLLKLRRKKQSRLSNFPVHTATLFSTYLFRPPPLISPLPQRPDHVTLHPSPHQRHSKCPLQPPPLQPPLIGERPRRRMRRFPRRRMHHFPMHPLPMPRRPASLRARWPTPRFSKLRCGVAWLPN